MPIKQIKLILFKNIEIWRRYEQIGDILYAALGTVTQSVYI